MALPVRRQAMTKSLISVMTLMAVSDAKMISRVKRSLSSRVE